MRMDWYAQFDSTELIWMIWILISESRCQILSELDIQSDSNRLKYSSNWRCRYSSDIIESHFKKRTCQVSSEIIEPMSRWLSSRGNGRANSHVEK